MKLNSLVNEATPDPAVEAGGDEGYEEAQGWEGPTEEQWTQMQEQNQAMLGYISQMQQQQQGNGPQIDPLSDNFVQQLDTYLEEKVAPYQQFTEQYQNQQADEMAWDMIADAESREGEFLLRETSNELPVASPHMARAIAEDLLPQMQQRYGANSQRAVEAALDQAVKYVRQYEQAIGEAYEQRKQNELRARLSAPMTPAASGQAAQSFDTGAHSEMDLVTRHTGVGLPR